MPFLQSIKIGDVLIGQVQQKNFHGLVFRVVATEDSTILRDVRELAIKVFYFIYIHVYNCFLQAVLKSMLCQNERIIYLNFILGEYPAGSISVGS